MRSLYIWSKEDGRYDPAPVRKKGKAPDAGERRKRGCSAGFALRLSIPMPFSGTLPLCLRCTLYSTSHGLGVACRAAPRRAMPRDTRLRKKPDENRAYKKRSGISRTTP